MATITFAGPSVSVPGATGERTVTLDDSLMVLGIMALCSAYRYPVNVANPAFNPDLPPDDESNPPTVPNPEGPDLFAVKQVVGFLKNHAHAYAEQAANANTAVVAAKQAVVAPVTSQINNIVIN